LIRDWPKGILNTETGDENVGGHILELLLDGDDIMARLRKPVKTKAELDEINRQRVAKHRAAKRAAIEAGVTEPTTANINQALADAALMILAVGGPGAEQVRAVLRRTFPAHPGTPMTVEAHARAGKLTPRLFNAK
jgi:hypothetical protein